jgi:hypothetical protein
MISNKQMTNSLISQRRKRLLGFAGFVSAVTALPSAQSERMASGGRI